MAAPPPPSPHIEGAAVDAAGNLYAVNFDRDGANVGRVAAAGGACAPAPAFSARATRGAWLNGLRGLPDGSFLGADIGKTRVVHLKKDGSVTTFCADRRGGGSARRLRARACARGARGAHASPLPRPRAHPPAAAQTPRQA